MKKMINIFLNYISLSKFFNIFMFFHIIILKPFLLLLQVDNTECKQNKSESTGMPLL